MSKIFFLKILVIKRIINVFAGKEEEVKKDYADFNISWSVQETKIFIQMTLDPPILLYI